jgi:alkylation response protein AidB-like acyl-CoA dehydrogenase
MIGPEISDAGAGLFTDQEREFRAEIRQWLLENPPPTTQRDGLHADVLPAQLDWERRLNEAGYGGLHWPVEFGGAQLSMTYQLVLAEELARARVMPFRHRPTVVGMFMAGPFIIALGDEEQKKTHLARILGVEDLWCQLFSEPDAGSDLASLRTTATPDGDHFVVRGQKIWNSYAHLADMGVLLARTDTAVPKHRGLTCFLLDMDLPGITVRPLRQINGGTEFNEVFFDDVVVPASAVIGGVDNGWRSVVTFLSQERSALQLGSYAEMLTDASALLTEHGARGLPATVLDRAMAAWTNLTIQRWMALSIAARHERGVASEASSLGKLHWAQNLRRLAELRVSLEGTGASAWVPGDEEPMLTVHSLLSSLSASIAGGTSEVQRNLLAERVLGLPRV